MVELLLQLSRTELKDFVVVIFAMLSVFYSSVKSIFFSQLSVSWNKFKIFTLKRHVYMLSPTKLADLKTPINPSNSDVFCIFSWWACPACSRKLFHQKKFWREIHHCNLEWWKLASHQDDYVQVYIACLNSNIYILVSILLVWITSPLWYSACLPKFVNQIFCCLYNNTSLSDWWILYFHNFLMRININSKVGWLLFVHLLLFCFLKKWEQARFLFSLDAVCVQTL